MAERLGQYLQRKGAITKAQLQEALRTQQFFGGNLGSHLIQLGYLDEDDLGKALSELLGVPYADRDMLRHPESAAVTALPPDFVKKHRALPFRAEKGELHMALQNPRDALGLHEASFLTGLQVVPYVCPEFRMVQAIEKHYRLRLDRRRGIRVPGGEPPLGPTPAPEAPPPEPPRAAEPPGPELGLDGRPLDAPNDALEPGPAGQGWPGRPEADAPSQDAAAAPPSGSLRRWREEEVPGEDPAAPRPRPLPPQRLADLAEAARGIAEAADRDGVARVALGWLSARYRRAALLSVQRDTAVGWTGTGPNFEPDRIRKVQVDLTVPSIFSTFRDGRSIYYGPVPNVPANQDLYTYLGGKLPASALVVPITIKRRTVALLYADNADQPMPPPDLVSVRRLATKIALGLEVLILRNKVLMA
jgi:hypothetical protein